MLPETSFSKLIRKRTTSAKAKGSFRNETSRFCNHFSIFPSHYVSEMYFKYFGIKLVTAVWSLTNGHGSLGRGRRLECGCVSSLLVMMVLIS